MKYVIGLFLISIQTFYLYNQEVKSNKKLENQLLDKCWMMTWGLKDEDDSSGMRVRRQKNGQVQILNVHVDSGQCDKNITLYCNESVCYLEKIRKGQTVHRKIVKFINQHKIQVIPDISVPVIDKKLLMSVGTGLYTTKKECGVHFHFKEDEDDGLCL